MRRILTPVILLVLLSPALVMGGEVKISDLVIREGLFYKKFTHVPFTGRTTENIQGSSRNGVQHDIRIFYRYNGQLSKKRIYKDREMDSPWDNYYDAGTVDVRHT